MLQPYTLNLFAQMHNCSGKKHCNGKAHVDRNNLYLVSMRIAVLDDMSGTICNALYCS